MTNSKALTTLRRGLAPLAVLAAGAVLALLIPGRTAAPAIAAAPAAHHEPATELAHAA